MKVAKNIGNDLKIKKAPSLEFSYKREVEDKKTELSNILKEKGLPVNDDSIAFAYDIIYEHAYHLDDILWRREGVAIFSGDRGASKLDLCSKILKEVLNYDQDIVDKEKNSYIKALTTRQKFM
jgi:glycerol-3-phosphate dehydrogenase